MGHTPIPWEVNNGRLIVVDCYGKVIASTDVSIDHPPKRYVDREESKANAEFIVKAVNCHEELIEELRRAKDVMQKHAPGYFRTDIERLQLVLARAERTTP